MGRCGGGADVCRMVVRAVARRAGIRGRASAGGAALQHEHRRTERCHSLDWDVLILIAGGLTLGYSLQVTALDERRFTTLAVLGFATFGFGTFFSNTAIASMLMPVAVAAAAGTTGLDLTSAALMVALAASMNIALPAVRRRTRWRMPVVN
jgi:di/tricarboxylate transporter